MRVAAWAFARIPDGAVVHGGRARVVSAAEGGRGLGLRLAGCVLLLAFAGLWGGAQDADHAAEKDVHLPPRVAQARRFLARRGWAPGMRSAARGRSNLAPARSESSGATTAWQPLGPMAVVSANYGLVTGRVSSLALDPADSTGNRLYVGTTGGGVWVSQNAATSDAANIVFTPLTDAVGALTASMRIWDPAVSISIGALTVQPGGTGVVLAGTGDPNDSLDSYYGAGILRSTDGGKTWSLIQATADKQWGFLGEGFAGFAWSTVEPQTVVAAVSQAAESALVNADYPGLSSGGLYYSKDAGKTWSFATVTDLNGLDVQGPQDAYVGPDGNPATAVVWNPLRNVFIAAVRYHGYYQSPDGVKWTRLSAQPGSGLTAAKCPANNTGVGSPACPIFRGALAVNPVTGDTFAWTVDLNNQDQGIWQDVCAANGNTCSNSITFGKQWNTAALETKTSTIQNGDYDLALAAVPSGQDTLLMAGANDLWKCSLAMGCTWRNTTNADTCMSAQVAGYQHALEWSAANPLEMFVGNDSGLWRSMDAVGQTGSVCASTDASHFQNLNGALGSLAEVEGMSAVGASPYTMMLGLGANGTAGVKSTTGPTKDWPQILGGEGGPVAVDPTNPANWYVNDGAGVSIHLCARQGACTPADFGASPVVSEADVANDGLTMTVPATFMVDPLDATQLLVGTCRVWRGPANGTGWTAANAIGPMLDGAKGSPYCHGNALIRSMAALPLAGGGEVVYVGMYGSANGGGTLPGHVLSATMSAKGVWSAWIDLTRNPVDDDSLRMNAFGLDISSLFIDPHDTTGQTLYVTVAGFARYNENVSNIYRTIDGGAHWSVISANLPATPANSAVVDPQDAGTVYLATDVGVYATQQVQTCASAMNCWFALGTGLPEAPVVGLSAAPANGTLNVLAAATYGRGVWQIPLLTGGAQWTTATVDPTSLSFGTQAFGTTSIQQTVTLTNTGAIALTPMSVAATGDFAETDNCAKASINAGDSCAIQVTFRPSVPGSRKGQLTIAANVSAGTLTVDLSGTGANPPAIAMVPASLDFGQAEVGTTSAAQPVSAENSGTTDVPITSVTVSGPFVLVSNSCGTVSLKASTDCQIKVAFAPAATGPATGVLTLVDGAGTQTVQLSGSGTAAATDTISPASLTFPGTIINQLSAAQTVTLTNIGSALLTSIAISVSGPFQVTSNCTSQLIGPASCSIDVRFAPTAVGTQTGTLTVSDLLRTQTAPLSGTGLALPAFTVSPISLTFPAQTVGVAGAPVTLTVTNSGGSAMSSVGFGITGQSSSSFSTGVTTCGAVLAAGSSCTVQVIYTPAASGLASATLTVTSSTQGVVATLVPLSGTGLWAAGLNASPAQLMFAAQALGQAGAPQMVTITDSGGTAANGLTLNVTGPFSLTQNTCGAGLAAGTSCTTGVVFTPTSMGTLMGTLTASSTSVTTPATVVLSGTGGLTGAVAFQPAQVSFPTTGVGTTSAAVTVTLTNSSASVVLTNLAVTVSSGFKIATNTCGSSLAAGAACSVGLEFAPTGCGAQTGTLSVTSSALPSAATAALSGMGFDFTAAASGASSKTVASGQTASFTLSVAPTSDSATTFTFQCSSLPSYAACTFNPSSETVAANTTGTETVQMTTSKSTAALARPAHPGEWGALTLACGLLMLPLACHKRRNGWLLALALAAVAAGAASCSSSGGGGTPAPTPTANATPPGAYSVPVTVTANGVQHSVTLTLVVD